MLQPRDIGQKIQNDQEDQSLGDKVEEGAQGLVE